MTVLRVGVIVAIARQVFGRSVADKAGLAVVVTADEIVIRWSSTDQRRQRPRKRPRAHENATSLDRRPDAVGLAADYKVANRLFYQWL